MVVLAIVYVGVAMLLLWTIWHDISDRRYRKLRTEYINSITIEEWLDMDIGTLCSKSEKSGCITVGHRMSIHPDVYIDVSPSFDYPYTFHYLRVRSPTRMVRYESTRDYFINYEIESIPNLVDALRMLKL